MNLLNYLSPKELRRAADLKEEIASLQEELSRYLNGAADAPAPGRKSNMSAAGRAKIAAAQRARWAKVNAGRKSTGPAKKKKRTMSAAAKAKIAAAAKARWAKAKAAGKSSL